METISNQTCTECQHCGEWTNYADDSHHKARLAEIERYQTALNEIASHTGSDDPCRRLVDIARKSLMLPGCAVNGVAIPGAMCVELLDGKFCAHGEACEHKLLEQHEDRT